MKLHLPLQRNGEWMIRACKLVDVAPHLASVATFVSVKQMGEWDIYNIETGLRVTSHFPSEAHAIRHARTIFAKYSPGHMEDLLRLSTVPPWEDK